MELWGFLTALVGLVLWFLRQRREPTPYEKLRDQLRGADANAERTAKQIQKADSDGLSRDASRLCSDLDAAFRVYQITTPASPRGPGNDSDGT